ncbi:MAG: hypothetical protein Fur0040_01330 [Sideroxydans sp.]
MKQALRALTPAPLWALLLALLVYGYGLGGAHVPTNGDEAVYAHITRLTAASGHWLPLQSELDGMRNTKPPLLFWQGMIATGFGAAWDWGHLRLPSLIYTLLTAGLLLLLGRRLGGDVATGVTAALCYLAFFSTYRYGRTFLTSPAETFWLFLPFFTLLYWGERAFASRWKLPLLFGVAIGIGLLYKSFALLAPVGLALAGWHLHQRRYQLRVFLREALPGLLLTAGVALALFALWFVFDPDPAAVWREFVQGENAGKFDPHGGSYWATLLWGGSSVWVLAAGYAFNAGLLAPLVLGMAVLAWRQRHAMTQQEKLIWLWLAALLLVFALPSQRSSRYLLEAMPGVALLLALHWQRIPRWVFGSTLLLCLAVLASFTYLAVRLQHAVPALYGWETILCFVALAALGVLAWLRAAWTRGLTHVVALLTLLALALLVRPLEGAAGRYDVAAQAAVRGQAVWVPCNFRAQFEEYQMLLPGARIHAYDLNAGLTPDELAARHGLFAVRLPLDAAPCSDCRVLGQRLELRSRHSDTELRRMLAGETVELLFVREWLLQSARAAGLVSREACR